MTEARRAKETRRSLLQLGRGDTGCGVDGGSLTWRAGRRTNGSRGVSGVFGLKCAGMDSELERGHVFFSFEMGMDMSSSKKQNVLLEL